MDIDMKVAKIAEQFETEAKKTLSKYEDTVDENTWNLLYDFGADIKHALDRLAEKD